MRNRRLPHRPTIWKPQKVHNSVEPKQSKTDRFFKRLTRFELIIGLLAIPFILIVGVNEIQSMAEQRRVNAWQLLTNDAPGNSGKGAALEFLNQDHYCLDAFIPFGWEEHIPYETHQCLLEKESFEGIDLSQPKSSAGTYLNKTNLPKANFSNAKLDGVNFGGVDVIFKDDAKTSNLRYVNFNKTSLKYAKFVKADLTGSIFAAGNLEGANFIEANLNKVVFASILGLRYQSPNISLVNFSGAIGLEQKQLDQTWAWVDTPPKNIPDGLFMIKLCHPYFRQQYDRTQKSGIPEGC